jgi:hypothetical protein
VDTVSSSATDTAVGIDDGDDDANAKADETASRMEEVSAKMRSLKPESCREVSDLDEGPGKSSRFGDEAADGDVDADNDEELGDEQACSRD